MTSTAQLRFAFDWESVDESVRSPELRATWARTEIWIGDRCATVAEDLVSGSVRRSVVAPLYPVAEWIVYNWWLLRFDGRQTSALTDSRRSVRSAGDGFVWPPIGFVPRDPVCSVEWTVRPPTRGEPIRYLASGTALIEQADFLAALTNLVEAVLLRLAEAGISDTPLHAEWDALNSLDAEEVEFCEMAARLGLDPLAEGVDLSDSIEEVYSTVDVALRVDFFDAVESDALRGASDWMANSMELSRSAAAEEEGLFTIGVVTDAMATIGPRRAASIPWERGYEVARVVRADLGMAATEALELLPVSIRVSPGQSGGLFGVGARGSQIDSSALVLARQPGVPAARFAAARALWHAGATGPGSGYLLTKARTASQQSGRAFAAELLAPAAGIQELFDGDPSNAAPEDLSELAEHFGTSSWVISYQVDNQLA